MLRDMSETSPARPRATPANEQLRSRTALVIAGVAGVLTLAGLWIGRAPALWMVLTPLLAGGVYLWLTRRDRRRARIRREPFPDEWERILRHDVAFFNALDEREKARFREHVQIFLAEKRVTGIRTELDERTRVLAAASAIIPIFGFPEWEWDQISEILIYPTTFDEEFGIGRAEGQRVLGMVGTGAMNRMMILSEPDLHHGFRDSRDRRNVGVHEFAHLVDKSDGAIDGVPGAGLSRHTFGPWIELVRRKMAEIEAGRSDIDAYALTNEAEFFAVATEYFFERPERMRRKHPQLYAMLARVFRQDMLSRVRDLVVGPSRGKLGRNSRCPCGSGRKYKKCCLGQAGAAR
jgi:Mlc titration factor MtfA (ptsG expression regulator)